MNPPSKDICSILAAASLGLTFGTNMFVGLEPDSPDTCVTVFDTPGYPPELTLNPEDSNFYRPSVQVRVRAAGYATAYELAKDIMVELHGMNHEEWGSMTYEAIKCSQEPFLLDYDTKNRPRFVANFDIQRKI